VVIRAKLHADGLKTVKYVHIDVTALATIQAAKETIDQADGKLDVLVNNAGTLINLPIYKLIRKKSSSGIGKLEENQNATNISLSTIREAMETNFFGLIQTTITLLPLVRKGTNAVILNVTIDMASNTIQSRPDAILHVVAYNTSKSAANSYTIALAQESKAEGIKVNAVTPGFTTSKLNHYTPGGKTMKEGAEVLLPWALLDKDGPTCMF
jgi:NAD(P)-dependent dehydrogenase (short-subunit alcohol dehydrogenase family)